MNHYEIIQLAVAYTCLGVFVITAAISVGSLVGFPKLVHNWQQKQLFHILIAEVVMIGVGYFSSIFEFNPVKVQDRAVSAAFQDSIDSLRSKILTGTDTLSTRLEHWNSIASGIEQRYRSMFAANLMSIDQRIEIGIGLIDEIFEEFGALIPPDRVPELSQDREELVAFRDGNPTLQQLLEDMTANGKAERYETAFSEWHLINEKVSEFCRQVREFSEADSGFSFDSVTQAYNSALVSLARRIRDLDNPIDLYVHLTNVYADCSTLNILREKT